MKNNEKPWFQSYPEDISREIEFLNLNLPEILKKSARDFPSKTALSFYNEKVTYKEFEELSNRFASFLQGKGVKKGDRVAFFLPNTIQLAVGIYGALKTGAVASPLNPLYSKRELEEIVNDSSPEVLVSLKSFYPKVSKSLSGESVKHVVFTDLSSYLPFRLSSLLRLKRFFDRIKDGGRKKNLKGREIHNFEEILEEKGTYREVELDPKEDLAFLMYTSGTTGSPKGVPLTHLNITSNLEQILTFIETSINKGNEVVLGVLPFFHIYGLNFALNFSVFQGFSLVLLPKFNTSPVCRALEREKVTIFPGVPAMFSAVCRAQEESGFKYDFSSVDFCGSGAAPCPISLIERVKKVMETTVIEAYGLTETSPITHMNPPSGEQRMGSIGLPLPETEAKIVKMEGEEELGQLALKGPQVFNGYWRSDEDTRNSFKDGWFLTGDTAVMDDDGYFYIQGRMDDMINVSGEKVWPKEIEDVIIEHPGVEDVAVVGAQGPLTGQIVRAFVVKKEKSLTKEKIKKFCEDKLAEYKTPQEVYFLSKLPKSHVGKTLHYVLKRE